MFGARKRRIPYALVGIFVGAVILQEFTEPHAEPLFLFHKCKGGMKVCNRETTVHGNDAVEDFTKKISWEQSRHKFSDIDLSNSSVPLPCCLVGFELNTSATIQYYDFLTHTPLNNMVRPYFDAALEFLGDVVAEHKQAAIKRVVWAMSDDGSLAPDALRHLDESGFVTLSHSVRRDLRWQVVLVPNFHYIQTRGFAQKMRDLSLHRKEFKDKRKVVFWRGVSTGTSASGVQSDRCFRLPRVMVVQASKDVPWLDFALTRAVQDCVGHEPLLQSLGLFGSQVAEKDWLNYRGILEIDGNVDSWGNYWRAASQSVLFKVSSEYVGYFTVNMVNGVHFVDVAADLSDLVAKTQMVTSDDPVSVAEMSRISRNSFKYITNDNFTYDSVVQHVAAKLFSLEKRD